jgi:acyl-CoA reductase-like NAD-dependent aldehyde dehydrogenase
VTETFSYQWSSDRAEDRFPVEDPATGEIIAIIQGGGAAEVDRAVRASEQAFQKWRWVSARERSAMLREISHRLLVHADEIAELEMLENGKPLVQASFDVHGAVALFDYFANLTGMQPTQFFDSGLVYGATLLEPYGVVAAIIPFNWPPVHAAGKIASALAVGNTIVVKPPEQDPRSVMRVVEIVQEVVPADVVQAVPGIGTDAGYALASHPLVRMITFTGSPATGSAVLRAAAEHHTPTMMELGGKNAMIILPDADIDPTVKALLESAYMNQGETCTAGSRILVHRSRHDEVVEKLGGAIKQLRVGPGTQPGMHVGPMVSKRHQERVLDYIRIGLEEGATIAAEGEIPTASEYQNGFWAAPMVLTGVNRKMRVAREEIFGPVTCVIPFDDVEEAISIANDTEFGLTAAVFTRDHPLALRIARHLDVGMVFINQYFRGGLHGMPFGGTKASGYGREHTPETLKAFGRVKLITMVSGLGEIPNWTAAAEVGL